MSLLGVDAGKVRFDVGKVVDVHDGEIAEEKTQTDDEGGVTRSRLVVRVPVGDFDAAMAELERVAQLVSSNRNTEDVTSEVIDTDVRIRAQSAEPPAGRGAARRGPRACATSSPSRPS